MFRAGHKIRLNCLHLKSFFRCEKKCSVRIYLVSLRRGNISVILVLKWNLVFMNLFLWIIYILTEFLNMLQENNHSTAVLFWEKTLHWKWLMNNTTMDNRISFYFLNSFFLLNKIWNSRLLVSYLNVCYLFNSPNLGFVLKILNLT